MQWILRFLCHLLMYQISHQLQRRGKLYSASWQSSHFWVFICQWSAQHILQKCMQMNIMQTVLGPLSCLRSRHAFPRGWPPTFVFSFNKDSTFWWHVVCFFFSLYINLYGVNIVGRAAWYPISQQQLHCNLQCVSATQELADLNNIALLGSSVLASVASSKKKKKRTVIKVGAVHTIALTPAFPRDQLLSGSLISHGSSEWRFPPSLEAFTLISSSWGLCSWKTGAVQYQ